MRSLVALQGNGEHQDRDEEDWEKQTPKNTATRSATINSTTTGIAAQPKALSRR